MPKFRLPAVAIIGFCGIFINSPASAEPKTAGRLADGRAFRVDENGYQLVDHIAELQVGNDDLRRQVAVLEAELEGAGRKIPEAAGRSQNDDVPNCNELVSSLHLKISRLEKQAGDGPRLPAAQPACDFTSPQNPLWKQIRKLEQSLAEAHSGPVAACDYQSEQNPLWDQVRSLQAERKESASRTTPEAELSTAAVANAPRARLDTPQSEAVPPRPGVRKPSSDTAPDTGLRADKRELQASLREVEQLILARKSAYDRLKEQKSTVTVSISPLRTASGLSLDTLRSRIASIGKQSNRAEMQRGLQEIETILKEDLKVLERLLKL